MFAPHGGGEEIYAVQNSGGNADGQLWQTVNGGGAWAVTDTIGWGSGQKGLRSSISIPYVDASNPDLYVLWGRGGFGALETGLYRISVDGGATFLDVPNSRTNQSKIGTGGHPDYIAFLGGDTDAEPCKWSNDRGLSYHTLPVIPVADKISSAAFATWASGVLQSFLMGTGGPTSPAYMYMWSSGQLTWEDKTGNLSAFSVGKVFQIDRDSMGAA